MYLKDQWNGKFGWLIKAESNWILELLLLMTDMKINKIKCVVSKWTKSKTSNKKDQDQRNK